MNAFMGMNFRRPARRLIGVERVAVLRETGRTDRTNEEDNRKTDAKSTHARSLHLSLKCREAEEAGVFMTLKNPAGPEPSGARLRQSA